MGRVASPPFRKSVGANKNRQPRINDGGSTDQPVPTAEEKSRSPVFHREFRGCNRTFSLLIGARVHLRVAHPEYADERTKTQRLKHRWTTEETNMLARREAELAVEGRNCREFNAVLCSEFPGRSLEAIKGHRRPDSYKRKVL